MGRSKSVPAQKQNLETIPHHRRREHEELLGRHQHLQQQQQQQLLQQGDTEFSLERLFASEIAQEISSKEWPVGLIPTREEDDDDDDDDDDETLLPPVVLNINKRRAAASRRGLQKKKQKKLSKKNKKRVQFSVLTDQSSAELGFEERSVTTTATTTTPLVVSVIPPPEIRILRGEEEEEDGNTESMTVLEYHDWRPHLSNLKQGSGSSTISSRTCPISSGTEDSDFTDNAVPLFVLQSFTLPHTRVQVVQEGEEQEELEESQKMPSSLPISTALTVTDLWKHYKLPTTSGATTTTSGADKKFLQALVRCVQERLVSLKLVVTSRKNDDNSNNCCCWVLRVQLTRKALHVCHADRLPFHRHSKTKLYRLADALECILTAFLVLPANNNNDVDDGDGHPVTAKQIYALMDNQQLQAALQKEAEQNHPQSSPSSSSTTLSIPGLLPTLRGYQAKAVEWMLHRERQTYNPNDEWELAWVVLTSSSNNNNHDCQTKVTSLPQFQTEQQQQMTTTGGGRNTTTGTDTLFYCPFSGWLATCYQDAKAMTISAGGRQDDSSSNGFGNGNSEKQLKSASSNSSSSSCCTGGMLAESMGLGKTVEVLGCILANPKPNSILGTGGTKRKLFASEDSKSDQSAAEESTTVADEDFDDDDKQSEIEGSNVGLVNDDINELGDAEDSSDDDDDENADSVERNSRNASEERETTTENDPEVVMASANHASVPQPVPVTPDKESVVAPPTTTWIDEDIIGSCICGELIGFTRTRGTVVMCRSCQEPMHTDCAGFQTDSQMRRECEPTRIRQQFTNKSLECLVCAKSQCPSCFAADGSRVSTGATLIITPPAILDQWEREIRRHTKTASGQPLKVLVYEGLRATTANKNRETMKLLHPRFLADADIVLITLDALMVDLGHSDDNKFVASNHAADDSSNLRNRKRYRVVPSPLISIHWWRVCLDEAQRVETPTAASARMALKLEAEHRWCVTGTPVGRGKLEDLYGLLLFLRIYPFADKQWFKKCLSPKYPGNVEERIFHLLRNVFWRSTKSFDLVREQMGVPEQVEKKIMLRFSSIEKHFYNRQLENTLSAVGDVVEREKGGKKRKSSQLDLLAEHLHRLRAACCHPQVGSSGVSSNKKLRTTAKNKSSGGTTASVGNRVMTMEQILDRFIDDVKLKSEEAQRLALMHANAMAAIARLKVEAKERGVEIPQTNESLLSTSCKLYMEALALSEQNAIPTLVVGEAVLTGSPGFTSPRIIVRDGVSILAWKMANQTPTELWSRIEFEGPSRKVTQLRLRPVVEVPEDIIGETSDEFTWHILHPKDCVFQVSASAVGGEFIDVASFSMSVPSENANDNAWIVEGGFRTNKSKSWRLLVKSFHQGDSVLGSREDMRSVGVYVGLEMELYEADIASDSLQRLHCLHNASISFELLLGLDEREPQVHVREPFSESEIKDKIKVMGEEAHKIESLYMELARSIHSECKLRLQQAASHRKEKENSLFALTTISAKKAKNELADCWDDGWWDDFLVVARLYGSESQQQSIFDRLVQDLDGFIRTRFEAADGRGAVKFPEFGDINGFRTALLARIQDIRIGLGNETSRKSETALRAAAAYDLADDFVQPRDTRFKCPRGGHGKCMSSIEGLPENPSGAEVYENSHCEVCKADWFRKGPKCRHCKLGEQLGELTPDRVTICALKALWTILRSPLGSALMKSKASAHVGERAQLFFDVVEAEKRELKAAWRAWRVHLDMLNDEDELLQCKTSMRLSFEGEDLTQLTEDELNAIVVPIDLSAKYHDHAAKQAMSVGDLRRAKDSLRYLRSQAATKADGPAGDSEEQCVLCLSSFDTERSVLRCGHGFHVACLDKLKARSSSSLIGCPMRCKVRTDVVDVMIASTKRKDDGTRITRQVKGSWGTKVTRLVSDILDVRDLGDKGIVFSQWEDMLDIVQHALVENGVQFVRATSSKKIGEITRCFRTPECVVLLLNVNKGAEGLTLLEATHVFMVEPLLNCGLDSQAISRNYRIGQNRRTFVFRYLVEDTVEVKIDKLRMEHQEDQLEDLINEGKKSAINAGGIDGGFQSQEEIFDLLQ